MVHTFKMFDKYIALDVNSGCVHDMDKLSYDIINSCLWIFRRGIPPCLIMVPAQRAGEEGNV